jgi:hypothetical protein
MSAAVADFDHDSMLDLAVGYNYGGPAVVYRGDGHGGFSVLQTTFKVFSPALTAVDLNSDGWVDLVASSTVDDDVEALLNHDGMLNSPTPLARRPNCGAPVFDFFNNDGAIDLACPLRKADGFSIGINNGQGDFSAGFDVLTDSHCDILATGHFESTGGTGVACLDKSSGFVTVFDPSQFSFTPIATLGPFAYVSGITAFDLNGDKLADLVVSSANFGSDPYEYSFQVLINHGKGTFEYGQLFSGTTFTSPLTLMAMVPPT